MTLILSFATWLLYSGFLGYHGLNAYRESRYAKFSFLFFSFYYFSIRPIFLFTKVDVPIPLYQFQYDFWNDILAANVLITFWVISTSTLSDALSKTKKFQVHNYNFGKVRVNKILQLSILLTTIGAIVTLFYVAKYGGFAQFLYQVKVEKSMAGLYVFREISSWALFISGLAFLFSLTIKKGKFLKFFSIAMITLNCLIIFGWGNRTVSGFFLFLLFVLYYSRYSKISLKNVIWVLLILVILGNSLRLIRDDLHSEATGHDFNTLEMMSPYTALALSMHWSEYDGLVLAVRDVGEKFSYRNGADFANGLGAWIPRFIWAEKPDSHKVGKWFRQVYEPQKENGWPITSLGNWFVNGGLGFVLLGITLTSMVIALLDNMCGRSLVLDYSILIFCVFVLHQGVDTGFIQKLMLTFIPYLFFLTITTIWFNNGKILMKKIT